MHIYVVIHQTATELRRALRKHLDPSVFRQNPARLGWFALHLSVVLLGLCLGYFYGKVDGILNWALVLPLGTIMGFSFAGLAFVAHETLHGAVVRSSRLKKLIGLVGFSPFFLSPRLWIAWHNRVHHGHTNVDGKDPDAYPSLDEYHSNRAARLAVHLGAPRSGKWRGIITFVLGFSIQSAQVLFGARRRGHLNQRHHRWACVESATCVLFWLVCAVALGPARFALLYGLPLVIANAIVMTYIVTNHSLSPLVSHDDPLASTLSVTTPRWYETFSLQFGYHVEHHIFPAMSHVHGPQVRDQIIRLAPNRYQSMSLRRALLTLIRTPRVYKDSIWLFDPETQQLAPTLLVAAPNQMVGQPTEGSVSDDKLMDALYLSEEKTGVRPKATSHPSQPPPRAGQVR